MGAIVGLFHLDGRPADRPQLDALAARPAGHPFTSPSGLIVSFDGRLDNRDELLAACGERDEVCPDAALVAAACERYGDDFLRHLAGDFAVATFDPRVDTLTLARDRMGCRPLYYAALQTTVVFGSDITSILSCPAVEARVDEDALADLAFDSYRDEHRSCFRGIWCVPPGQAVIVRRSGITRRVHWDFDPSRRIRYRAFDEYVAHFRELFERSIRVRMRTDAAVGVAVSGGVDSSAIFGQAMALARRNVDGPAVRGFSLTFPEGSDAHEEPFVDALSRGLNATIDKLPVRSMKLLPHADDLVKYAEVPAIEWDARADLMARARDTGCGVLLDGHFGDHALSDRTYLIDLTVKGRWLAVRRELKTYPEWSTDVDARLFGRQYRAGLVRALPPRWLFHAVKNRLARRRRRAMPPWYTEPFVRRAVSRAMERRDPARRFESYHAQQLYRLATSGHERAQRERDAAMGRVHGVDVLHPFRDRELLAFLMAIPGDVVNYGGVPKRLLREAISGLVPDEIRLRRSKADFTSSNTDAILSEYDEISALLGRNSFAARAGLVDGAIVERELQQCRGRLRAERTAFITRHLTELLGLELWLRTFFGATLGPA